MPIELHLSKDFRKQMGSITQGLSDTESVGLVYNEMMPKRSFFVLPREEYLGILNTLNPEEMQEIKDILTKLDADVIKKYKAMIRKRYAKNVQ